MGNETIFGGIPEKEMELWKMPEETLTKHCPRRNPGRSAGGGKTGKEERGQDTRGWKRGVTGPRKVATGGQMIETVASG